MEDELARIAGLSDGQVAAAALHLESGRTVGYNADTPAPMASTVKVALAVEVLAQVDVGRIALDTMLHLAPHHLRPGHGIITAHLGAHGVSLSLATLLRLMLVESDNTATDILFDVVGGSDAVAERLRTLGIHGISVDRSILQVISDRYGVESGDTGSTFDLAAWRARRQAVSTSDLAAATRTFLADPRDTATPAGMVQLLAAIHSERALPPARATELLALMQNCASGNGRMRARLQRGAHVAHKTGTMPGIVAADVGIVALGQKRGHVALAVFVTASSASSALQDLVIADLSRASCDHFSARLVG